MHNVLRASIMLLVPFTMLPAQNTSHRIALPEQILLWPNGAPGAQGNTEADKPSLTIYPSNGPQKVPTGVLVFPGGGYQNLSLDLEGTQIAAWLNSYGITAFVLKYRLGPAYRHPIELQDAQRAIRFARAHAKDYSIDPQRIGVWGFSAGGHLASTTATHFDNGQSDNADPVAAQSCRPDFVILAYPVITFKDPYAHVGSRDALLGKNPDPALVELLSNETQVTKQAPPTFLFHTADDPVVPVQNSIDFYRALRAADIPAEMHLFEHGAHGAGLARDKPELSVWPDLLASWLKQRGLR